MTGPCRPTTDCLVAQAQRQAARCATVLAARMHAEKHRTPGASHEHPRVGACVLSYPFCGDALIFRLWGLRAMPPLGSTREAGVSPEASRGQGKGGGRPCTLDGGF